jgi:hypothetical protein
VKKTTAAGLLFAAIVLAAIVYSTVATTQFRCEVCITYDGRTACRTAKAGTREQAQRTATENVCSVLGAAGQVESRRCETTPADSIKWLSVN